MLWFKGLEAYDDIQGHDCRDNDISQAVPMESQKDCATLCNG